MHLSTKSYYGLKAIIALAKKNKFCSVREISSKEHLPEKYLEKIFQELKSNGFLVSQKGAGGGYALARPPQKIGTGKVIMALEKEEALTRCQTSCPMAGHCSAKTFWQEMEQSFRSSMGSTTLADLIK
jgi:Rrf2 family protein